MAEPLIKMPIRAIIWLMILTSCMMSYMLRVNMSINLIAMVSDAPAESRYVLITPANGSDDSALETQQATRSECLTIGAQAPGNGSEGLHAHFTSLPDYGPRYDWNGRVQGLILGAFFWGYIVSSMPGGLLAEKVGPTLIITLTMGASALLTMLTPAAAALHYGYVIAIRILLGLLGGVVYPALHSLIARWSPPTERGKFIGALMGGTLGTVVTWPMLGTLIESCGWYWAFLVPGGVALAWVVAWMVLVSDTPEQHPRITDDEKFFIVKSLSEVNATGGGGGGQKAIPPYADICGSVAFWALAILHFGNTWGLYLLLTAGPMYMSDVLGFELGNSGLLAALPYLARLVSGIIFGTIGDVVRKSGKLSVTNIRKVFIIFSHFLPGLFLVAQTFIGCEQVLAVVFLTCALGFNGASTVTNLQNAQDLSSNYAGSIYGIINCIGGTTGFITPMLTGFITEEHNGLAEWRIIFWVGAAVYICCGLVFCCLGSGKQQPWNDKAFNAQRKKEKTSVLSSDPPTKDGIDNLAFTTNALYMRPSEVDAKSNGDTFVMVHQELDDGRCCSVDNAKQPS